MCFRRRRTADVPFSLVCSECDAGSHIKNWEQAVAEGWSNIDYAPSLPMANYIGHCPECRGSTNHWPLTGTDAEDG
jgi:hypothetical protein